MLERLKRRLSLPLEIDKDELLLDLLDDARSLARGYTGRSRLPAILNGVVVELAAGAFNCLGLEGMSSHSDGGASQGIAGLPAHLKSVLDMHRVGKVGEA